VRTDSTYELDEADFALDDGLHGPVVPHGGHDDAEQPAPPDRVGEEEGHERHAQLQQRDRVARVAVLVQEAELVAMLEVRHAHARVCYAVVVEGC